MEASKYSSSLLDKMRQIGDPDADRAIATLFDKRETAAVRLLLDQLISNDAVPSQKLPEEIRDFWQQSVSTAETAAMQVKNGEQFFADHGPEIIMLLGCYSLPTDYAATGVKVLYQTGFLARRPNRRLFETMQMVVDVMSPGGLTTQGRGISTALKVRLMHAAIRHLIRHGSANPSLQSSTQPWDESLGVPINQEDLAGTLMSFSYLVLDGLRKLRVRISPIEAQEYLDAWRAVGKLMGIRPDLIPENLDQARQLTVLITARQIHPSYESRVMITALLRMFEENIPGMILKGIPPALMRTFLSPEVADGLGIPRSHFCYVVVHVLAILTALMDLIMLSTSDQRWLFRQFSVRLIQYMISVDRGPGREKFKIPVELDKQWKISPDVHEKTIWQDWRAQVAGFFEF